MPISKNSVHQSHLPSVSPMIHVFTVLRPAQDFFLVNNYRCSRDAKSGLYRATLAVTYSGLVQ
jgi:hypothetical protein